MGTGSQHWSNYQSAEEEPQNVKDMLGKMKSRKCCRTFTSLEDLARALGVDTSAVTLNKLGLLSKEKPDGSFKYRIIWDLSRSRVNAAIRQGERIILPRLLHIIRDALELAQFLGLGEDLEFYGIDIADAFHNIPIHPDEKRFACAMFEGGLLHL